MAGKQAVTVKKSNPVTKNLFCSCKHEYQDKKYGAGKRVHNRGAGDKYTCTVCDNSKVVA